MFTRYYKTNADDGAEIKIKTTYSLGGLNYWTYETDPRGYSMIVQRVVRSSDRGFSTERFTIGQGFRVFLKEVKRQSKKAEAEADALALARADELAERMAAQEGLTLTGEVAA